MPCSRPGADGPGIAGGGGASRAARQNGLLALHVGQALCKPAVADADDVYAAHMPLSPVVTPAHDGAVRTIGELLLDGEPRVGRRVEQVCPDAPDRGLALVAGSVGCGGGGLKDDVAGASASAASRSWALRAAVKLSSRSRIGSGVCMRSSCQPAAAAGPSSCRWEPGARRPGHQGRGRHRPRPARCRHDLRAGTGDVPEPIAVPGTPAPLASGPSRRPRAGSRT